MNFKYILTFAIIIIIALAFRLPGLSFRTMHGDEAVNAVKFSQLLQEGEYRYNAAEYHGPALYYFSIPAAITFWQFSLQDLSEVSLRIVPVFFCLALFMIFLSIKDMIGQKAFLGSVLLLAISPVFVFYSRYYIHEMLLVFFSYAMIFSAVKLYQKRKISWAISWGTFLALMMATKETWIILITAFIFSFLILITFYPVFRERFINKMKSLPVKLYIAGISGFLVIYVLLFTSFLKNMPGLWDSFLSIAAYSSKSAGNSVHLHPWYQYVKWLLFSSINHYFYSEGIIAVLAITGIFYGFKNNNSNMPKYLFFIRFMSLYTVLSMLIFSVILYKTPWNALSFWLGMIILAGFGFMSIWQSIKSNIYKKWVNLLLSIFILHLAWQSYRINFIEYENPANPYVYAQPLKDVLRILEPLRIIAVNHPHRKDIYIQVIVKDNDYWPLPWYLRDFQKTGWWGEVDMNTPSADIIIISPDMENDLIHKLYEVTEPGERDLYVPLLNEDVVLRPGMQLKTYVKLDTRNMIFNDKN